MDLISREEVKELLDARSDFKLVNVLSRDSFAKVHISGSINVPLKEDNFEKRFTEAVPDKNARIVVYCSSPD